MLDFTPTLTALLPVFNALPAPYLLLTPGLVIEAVSDAYLAATLTQRADLLGRRVLEVFPDNPDTPDAQGVRNLGASLAQVLATGQPHEMARQHYDVPDPDRPGHFVERHWLPRNTPVLDAQGRVSCIIHAAPNVTEQVQTETRLRESQTRERAAAAVEAQRQQVQALNEELAATNEELHASNEEFLQANAELTHAQLQLRQLNQELETRMAARTQDARAARTETERQRRQLEDLFMRAPAAICILGGPDWVYELVNPGYQQLFAGRRLLGLPLLQALPELAGQPVLEIVHGVYDTGIPFEGKEVLAPLVRREGGPIEDSYFDLTYQARFDERGQIDGFVTYANDVTEQVLARQERAVQEQRLRELFEQAPVAISVFRGADYVLDVVNPSMSNMWGHLAANLVGQPFFLALPELEGQGLRELLDGVRQSGQPYAVQERPVQFARHRPGEAGYFNFVYQPLRAADGQQTGIVCVATEVTDQVLARRQVQNLNEELAAINEEMRATNEELADTNRQLTRTNVDLDNFIYTASHDLKQPIANIEGLLQALTYELPAEARRAALVRPILERMHAAVERFQKTIGDLTEVSKLQQAHAQPAQEVLLGQVVAEVVLDLDPVLLAAQGQLTVAVPPGQVVTFSEKNLRSVVYNLLSNAIKYCAPDRPLRISLSSQAVGNRVELRVQDNGLGLSAAQQARLFGLFQRLHTHVEGTGIGLYMVKKIVENAGGTIAVQSELGVGSSFVVSLPN